MAIDFVQLLGVLGAAWIASLVAVRLGMPAVLGELAAGVVLGPTLLGLLEPSAALDVLAEVGVYLLMLYIGMEIQPRHLLRASNAGLLAAVGGFVVPFVLGMALMHWAGYPLAAGLFMGMAMGVTSLATKSRILVDLQLVGTHIASVMMVGALFADTLALVIFAAIIGFAESGGFAFADVALTIFKALLFFGIAGLIGIRVFPLIGARMEAFGVDKRTGNFTLVLLVALIFGELAHAAGLHGILGAFVAGIFLQEGIVQRKWSHEITQVVHDLSVGFLAPVFFVSAGFQVSLDVIWTHTGLFVAVVALATVGKIAGTVLFYLPSGRGWREGLAVGAGMNGRGAVEVIVAEIGLALGLITQEVFSILVLMAFLTTLSVPVLLGAAVRWLKRRGELKRDDEDRQRTVILGATPYGVALALALRARGPVVLIERNPLRARSARAQGLEVVEGDALAHDALAAAGADQAHTLISALSDVPAGLVAARYAHSEFGVPLCAVPASASAGEAAAVDRERYGIRELAVDDERLAHLTVQNDSDHVPLREAVVPHADAGVEELVASFGPDAIPVAVGSRDTVRPLFKDELPRPGERIVLLVRGTTGTTDRRSAWGWLQAAPIVPLECTTSRDCLAALAEALAQTCNHEAAAILAALEEREAEAPTTIAPGVAVPHITLEGIGTPRLVLGRSRRGVVTQPGQSPTHLWFAVASDPKHRDWYLWTLWAIARLAGDPLFITRWASAENARLGEVLAAAIARAAGEDTLA